MATTKAPTQAAQRPRTSQPRKSFSFGRFLLGALALVIWVVALIAIGSGTGGRSSNEDEEEIRSLKEIIARDVERERARGGASAGDVLTAVVVAVVLATIIIFVLGGSANAMIP